MSCPEKDLGTPGWGWMLGGSLGVTFSLCCCPQKTFTPNIISRKIKEE